VVLLLAALLPLGGWAQTNFFTILTNGPASNRFNIVFLAEGYTASQTNIFGTEATNALNALLAWHPYQDFSNFFNAFGIFVPSVNSGSDHPALGVTNNTYFNSSYDTAYDYYVTIPPNAFDANTNHGQAKVDSLLAKYMPRCALPILLVGDSTPGASDGGGRTAIAATNTGVGPMTDLLSHETGHVVANLGDEYNYDPLGTVPSAEEPNTTRETNWANIKWNAWISTNTPVPTPPTYDYSAVVGLFEGAHYSPTNWYRPQLNCNMNTPGVAFCAVCTEALVLAFYQQVRPIDSFTPANSNLTVTNTQPLAFSLSLLQPVSHNLSVQWLTNGAPVSEATNTTFSLLPSSLANGTNRVSLVALDPTALVRNDPANLLRQTNTWTLDVRLPQLALDSPRWLTGGKFAFRVTGNAPQGFAIWGSTNLSNWLSLSTNALVGGQLTYTNTTAAPYRAYRARTPP
jgi:hypothetical protein